MPEAEKKSPALAAVITLALPGFGHFYAGTWVRGVGVWLGLYVGFTVCLSAGMIGFAGVAALYGLAAWDAYRMAKLRNKGEPAAAAPAPPSVPLRVLWGACRSVWILALFGYGALAGLAGALDAIFRRHSVLLALVCALPGLAVTCVVWLAARDTWRGLRGEGKHTAAAMRDEAGAALAVAALAGVGLAICWPMFSQLIRASGEGAMKGNLGAARQAIGRYQAAHAGAAPPSLEAAFDKDFTRIPLLWSSSSVGSHKSTSETIALPDRAGTDSGKWAYVVSPSSPELGGVVFIDCTHTDRRGSVWTSY